MRRRSLVTRVVRGMIIVAILSSFALAGAAALVSRLLWRSGEKRALSDTTVALASAIQAQAAEDAISFEEAGPEAIQDSAIVGYRIEIWSAGRLVTQSPSGKPLGPPPAGAAWYSRDGWLVRTREFPGGATLLLGAPEEGERRAIGVFAWSLSLSLPVCLLLAVVVGGIVGRRATRPLVDFTRRVIVMRDLSAAGAPSAAQISDSWTRRRERTPGEEPAEVADLEDAFQRLLDRLSETLRRELEFAANASHELRTPLTTMRLYAEEAWKEATPPGRHALEQQMREIDRMVRLIDSLLVMARDSRSRILHGEVVNVADLVREVSARIFDGAGERDPSAAPDLQLPDEVLVRGDENLIAIAVENLLDNARKFTSPGLRVRVTCDQPGPCVRISVVSPGARIGVSERETLFERFYRGPEARARHSGHGLGLPLSRHIARVHGGDVRCTSSPSEDACFTLEIPVWQSEPQDGRRSMDPS